MSNDESKDENGNEANENGSKYMRIKVRMKMEARVRTEARMKMET